MLDALVEAVSRYTDAQSGSSPYLTAIDGFIVMRTNQQKPPSHIIHKPALCLVVQGAKWTAFGDRRYHYRAGQALMVNVEMPASGQVSEASPDKPYLGIVIQLDLGILREVWEGLDNPLPVSDATGPGVFVTDFDGPLADCALRAVRLLDQPQAIPVLYPAIMREICYWLLSGPHGAEVARMTLAQNHTQRVINAIHMLRARYTDAIRVHELAAVAQLSPSAFHRHFKALTSMTPLQYQKRLRLLEARRLMVSGAANVEDAAFQVGYESPSQFSREYARMFGAPPRRDTEALRRLEGSRAA
ncbi:AraC family transcriptional regulator [Nitrospirillum viridazoti]|uniref:AraC family transcriptional regulator n=1 Tax=Nitrospirillum viridazoti CBAmc TaxID=1441467 RepID=A0A248JX73_9PROT|nr:AraC family transcriptional regulator [Nitrospirillum amazonense]ASG23317.1 AraC family transcriptional regulator [Nitrospirillum amazonense CBAmc]TWB40017.1 AraC-like DNA-binding protein [Nitrospirillum amazonense]